MHTQFYASVRVSKYYKTLSNHNYNYFEEHQHIIIIINASMQQQEKHISFGKMSRFVGCQPLPGLFRSVREYV